MQKKYSKSELEKQANVYFSENEDVAKVFCTTDGQIFLEENRADLHAKSEEKMAVFAFQNPRANEEVVEAETEISLKESAGYLIGAFQLVTDVELLKKFLAEEQEGKKRKTVLEVLESRIAELATEGIEGTEDVEGSEDEGAEEGKDETK
ncbi:hypothetical protein [Faecalibacter macacae]|uniref:Uncharacterized protein n=1 Tax=Faecalibacter macacae TaxID=1859289 RepID=A0A3L9M6E5_9FLAO|nr:hypothetical protein [Faecalibacter macacae]RLZ08595.1 hypothetical protein EAH69_09785 [Faecalibacter macacae]